MISVLTVNYYSAVDLRRLVDSLREHAGGLPVELIITNNSADETLDIPGDSALPITIIPSPNVGFGAGINRAFRAARGETIFIANPDVLVTAGVVQGALDYLSANPDVGIVLPFLRYPDGEVQYSVRRFYSWPVVLYARSPLRAVAPQPKFFRDYLCHDIDRTRPSDVDWGLGGAMFLRRCDLEDESAGIFDERFFLYFEDVDLCLRTWRRGKRVVYCPQLECVHDHRRSSKQPVSKAGWYHFQSLFRFVGKHGGLPRSRRA